MSRSNGRAGLHLSEITVRRTPGITHEFTLRELSPGINIVYGPNASGKTTTAQIIRGILWRDALLNDAQDAAWRRAEFTGRYHLDGQDWLLHAEGSYRRCQCNGADASEPVSASDNVRRRYLLTLHDLLQQDSEAGSDLAAAILRESVGGYDLAAAMRACGFDRPPTRPKGLRSRVASARRAVQEIQAEYERLRAKEATLDDLFRRRQELQERNARRTLVIAAREHARARVQLDEAQRELERFDPVLDKLRGDELERLEEIDRARRTAQATRDAAAARLEAARHAQANTGLAPSPPERHELITLRQQCQNLHDLEQQLLQAERRLAEARAARDDARRRISNSISAEQLTALERQGLDQLSQLLDELATVRTQDEAIARLQDWVGPIKNPEDAERLHSAIAELAEWLRSPEPVTAPDPAPNRLGRVAAVLVIIEGIALGALVHPLLYLLALAGVALILVLRRAAAPAAPAFNAAEAARERYLRTGLESPRAWSVEEVEKHFDILVRRYIDARADQRTAERWGHLEPERQRLAETLQKLESAVREIQQEHGLTEALTTPQVTLLARNLADWQEADRQVAAATAESAQLRQQHQSLLDQLNQALARFGYAAAADHASVRGHVTALEERTNAFHKEVENEARAKSDLDAALEQIADADAKRAALLEPLSLTPDEVYRLQRWITEELQRFNEAKEAKRAAEIRVGTTRQEIADHPDLLQATESELEAELATFATLEDELATVWQEIGDIEGQIRAAKQKHALEEALAAEADALDELRVNREAAYANAVGAQLSRFIQAQTRDHSRPKVFHRARELFSLFTHGRYELDLDDSGATTPTFRAIDTTTGRGHGLDELSSATRLQLLMAVRVAFVEEMEQGPRLPLILDETLGNSDEVRAQAIISATIEICRLGRQVFYFTAQTDEVAKWKAILESRNDVPYQIHDLAEIRQLAGYQRSPLPDPTPVTAEIPAPNGTDRHTYGQLINAPGINWRDGAIGEVHLWHLVTDLDVLHQLLNRGITTWGQYRSLATYAGVEDLPGGRTAFACAEARAQVLDAAIQACRVGRGRPVDRAVLEESGAITDRFIDRVSDLANHVGGDAKTLVQRLGNGAVPRFRDAALTSLTEYLVEHGYLDEDEPLSEDEIRMRALAAGNAAINASLVTPDEIHEIVNHLLHGVA